MAEIVQKEFSLHVALCLLICQCLLLIFTVSTNFRGLWLVFLFVSKSFGHWSVMFLQKRILFSRNLRHLSALCFIIASVLVLQVAFHLHIAPGVVYGLFRSSSMENMLSSNTNNVRRFALKFGALSPRCGLWNRFYYTDLAALASCYSQLEVVWRLEVKPVDVQMQFPNSSGSSRLDSLRGCWGAAGLSPASLVSLLFSIPK